LTIVLPLQQRLDVNFSSTFVDLLQHSIGKDRKSLDWHGTMKSRVGNLRFVSISIQVCVVQVTIKTYMPFFSYAIRECLKMPSLLFQKTFQLNYCQLHHPFLHFVFCRSLGIDLLQGVLG
jgi:hypothetical protein